jgi:hypothetical protein
LCGRFVSLNHFDPSEFEDDIYVVEVRGLGRGRGVEVSERYSILKPGDETVELIKDRILDLARLLLENGCLRPEEALSELGIETGEELSQIYETITGLVRAIDEALGEEYEPKEDEEEHPLKALKERIKYLIEEHEALSAEVEQHEREHE